MHLGCSSVFPSCGQFAHESILLFFCLFFKFSRKFVFGRVGLVLGAFSGGANFDLLAGLWFLGVAPSVKRGISGFKCSGQNPGGGALCLYLLYGAKTPRLKTVSGGGLLCDSGGGLSLPVSLSHYRGGFGCGLGCSGDIRTSVRNKCSSGFLCDSQNLSNRILTEFQPNLRCQSNRILTESRNLCR